VQYSYFFFFGFFVSFLRSMPFAISSCLPSNTSKKIALSERPDDAPNRASLSTTVLGAVSRACVRRRHFPFAAITFNVIVED